MPADASAVVASVSRDSQHRFTKPVGLDLLNLPTGAIVWLGPEALVVGYAEQL